MPPAPPILRRFMRNRFSQDERPLRRKDNEHGFAPWRGDGGDGDRNEDGKAPASERHPFAAQRLGPSLGSPRRDPSPPLALSRSDGSQGQRADGPRVQRHGPRRRRVVQRRPGFGRSGGRADGCRQDDAAQRPGRPLRDRVRLGASVRRGDRRRCRCVPPHGLRPAGGLPPPPTRPATDTGVRGQVASPLDARRRRARPPGGRVAFFGPPDVAVSYFRDADPADVFLALDRASAESWQERFRSDPAHNEYIGVAVHEAPPVERREATSGPRAVPGWFRQLRTLTARYLNLIRSDRRHVALLTLQGPILGLLLFATLTPRSLAPIAHHALPALVTQHRMDVVSVALFLALSVTWLGVANAIREIVKEHKTLVREEGTGLSLRGYVGAKAITLGALTIVQAAVLAVIACG